MLRCGCDSALELIAVVIYSTPAAISPRIWAMVDPFAGGAMREILLQQIPHLWRADSLTANAPTLLPSGFAALDQALGGGWPAPGLLELLCDQWGIGELQLLLPLMGTLLTPVTGQAIDKPVLWINPPYLPQAVALLQGGIDPVRQWLINTNNVDASWAMEQALRSNACSLVIAWLSELQMTSLRRLKLAAAAGQCVGVLFRSSRVVSQSSPANVRLLLRAHSAGLQIELLKVQGRRPGKVLLQLPARQLGSTQVS